jgi:hypothetical protein
MAVPYQPDTSYFVRLDAPPASSRHTPLQRERHWEEPVPVARGSSKRSGPAPRRRKRPITIRPAGVLALVIVAWVAWAYTTPGGPSARINSWIDRTRNDVADVSLGPGLHHTADYFQQLYASQGSYPNMSDTQIQQDPNAGFGLSMRFSWCGPQAVVLQSLGAGGSVSRLLVAGKDLGNVSGAIGCPANLSAPLPWRLSNAK